MKKKAIMFKVLMSLFASLFGAETHALCPDLTKNETLADCPWADVTRATSAITDPTQIETLIDQAIPGFMNQIHEDGNAPHLLALWGMSHNVDVSDPNDFIVPVNLLQLFSQILQVSYNADFSIGHAGLNHTYGYLFSTLQTPYGYKRARYVQGEIEAGFGIPSPLFNGQSVRGTLLSNLTTFVGNIAFRNDGQRKIDFQNLLAGSEISTLPELVNYPYSELQPTRLIEVVKTNTYSLEIRTDIVPFTHANPNGSDTALLIYSIDYHLANDPADPRIITAFPVASTFAAGIFNPAQLTDLANPGSVVPINLNYNAALPVTLPATEMVGKRFIDNEQPNSN